MTLAILLLAAGHGTRMRSKYQKVLHDVGGKPMVLHIFEAAEEVADTRPVIVIGAGETGIPNLLGDHAEYVVQRERLGTGHATQVARQALAGRATQVLVTYGDMPLLTAGSLRQLSTLQAESGAAIAMLTNRGDPASTFGRVLRDDAGCVVEIVEVANARGRPDGDAILAHTEHNPGVYCFDAAWLWANVDRLPLRQARSGAEYYLTDMIALAVDQQLLVEAVMMADPDEALGAGTRAELVVVEKAFRRRANRKWLAAGVSLIDPATTYIDPDVVIGRDTVIWPNSYLQGRTCVGEDCLIGPNAILRDVTLGDGCRVEGAVLEGAELPDGSHVPPFTVRTNRARSA